MAWDDGDEPFYIDDVVCTGETQRAIFVKSETAEELEGEEVSIPKSQLHGDSQVFEKGETGTLAITKWLARERGWEL